MNYVPGTNELRYRRRRVWQELRRGHLLNALMAAHNAWAFSRFLKQRAAR